MLIGGWVGLVAGGLLCGLFALLFHYYVVRIFKARDWLTRGALLVDVDEAGEFARHHPRVAVSIPLEELARRAHELGGPKQRVVIFAHRWSRGARAAQLLRAVGFEEVMNAAGVETKEKLSAEAARVAARKAPEVIELAPSSPKG
jgi:rhodanese-related sulfurtransferase